MPHTIRKKDADGKPQGSAKPQLGEADASPPPAPQPAPAPAPADATANPQPTPARPCQFDQIAKACNYVFDNALRKASAESKAMDGMTVPSSARDKQRRRYPNLSRQQDRIPSNDCSDRMQCARKKPRGRRRCVAASADSSDDGHSTQCQQLRQITEVDVQRREAIAKSLCRAAMASTTTSPHAECVDTPHLGRVIDKPASASANQTDNSTASSSRLFIRRCCPPATGRPTTSRDPVASLRCHNGYSGAFPASTPTRLRAALHSMMFGTKSAPNAAASTRLRPSSSDWPPPPQQAKRNRVQSPPAANKHLEHGSNISREAAAFPRAPLTAVIAGGIHPACAIRHRLSSGEWVAQRNPLVSQGAAQRRLQGSHASSTDDRGIT